MFSELTESIALLLALSLLQSFVLRFWRHNKLMGQITSGLLFGGICVIGMITPLYLTPGVIIDPRSVVLSMSGLFGGPIVGGIAAVIAGGYRIWIGGAGANVGVAVVFTSMFLGLAYGYCRDRGWLTVGILQFLAFGFIVHAVELALFMFLPTEIVQEIMSNIAIPLLVTFTSATALFGMLLQDINNRMATEQALRDSSVNLTESRENLRTTLNSIGDAVISSDTFGKIVNMNPVAARLTGWDIREAIGRSMTEVFHIINAQTRKPAFNPIDTVLASGKIVGLANHTILMAKDGTEYQIADSAAPIKDQDGDITGVVLVFRDVTEDYAIQEELRKALVDAERSNQAKSEFLATMSHEFRTPLNAILGFSEMLRAEYFGPLGADNYKDYANDIYTSGEHMLELVSDMLDIAAIEAGKRPMVKENVDVSDVLKACLRKIDPTAKDKGHNLSLDVADNLSSLYIDKRSITQITLNLLSNAVKFTEQGGSISVSLTTVDNKIAIQVRDTGIGIPADKLSTVTDPFSRTHSDPHLTQDGTGLGLSIVKSLVEANDGELNIESEFGKGTIITVTFPYHT